MGVGVGVVARERREGRARARAGKKEEGGMVDGGRRGEGKEER